MIETQRIYGHKQVWRGEYQSGGKEGQKSISDIENMQWFRAEKEIEIFLKTEVIQYIWSSFTSRRVEKGKAEEVGARS